MFTTLLNGKRLFIITIIVFVVLVTFIDKNNLLDSWQLKSKITDLEEQREYYLKKIEEDSLVLEKIKDDKFLEQFARENYYMKREGEEIYLVR